jgi:hypothetical protein
MYLRGDPWTVLDKCSKIYSPSLPTEMTEERRQELLAKVKEMLTGAKHIMAFARLPLEASRFAETHSFDIG